MRGGRLRGKITFQEAVEAPDDYGQMVITYTDRYTARADIIFKSGKELFDSDEKTNNVSGIIECRYGATDIDPINVKYRIKDENTSRFYDMESIINIDQRNHKITMAVSDHANQNRS